MARPVKRGLRYFPRTVDYYNDPEIMTLLEKYGPLGAVIYDIIVHMIFDESYYLEMPLERLVPHIVRIIGNRWASNRELVLRVIRYCGEIGLLHDGLIQQGVFTSAVIQKQYADVTARNKPDTSKYWLLDESEQPGDRMGNKTEAEEETPVFAAKTPVTSGVSHSNKIKENIIKSELSNNNTNTPPDREVYAVSQSACNNAALRSAAEKEFSAIREPTASDSMRLGELCSKYGETQVIAAIREAIRKGGRSVGYVAAILSDLNRPAASQPTPSGTQPPTKDGMYVCDYSDEELERMLDEEWLSEAQDYIN